MAKVGEWQMQTAKAQFSEVFRRACQDGPQRVTRHGKEAVIVLAEEQYERLRATTRPNVGLATLLASSPLAGLDLRLDRPRDYGRTVRL